MADETPRAHAFDAEGRRFAIVAARFNQSVVEPMLESAVATLQRHGATAEDIAVARVPGAFELPLAARWFARESIAGGADAGAADAVIALGAVIRGETPHFDFVASECAAGLQRVAVETEAPVVFGVLTTDTREQAMARADPKRGDKGGDAARAALEMVAALESIRGMRNNWRARQERKWNAAFDPR